VTFDDSMIGDRGHAGGLFGQYTWPVHLASTPCGCGPGPGPSTRRPRGARPERAPGPPPGADRRGPLSCRVGADPGCASATPAREKVDPAPDFSLAAPGPIAYFTPHPRMRA
jgi:hypothetical protein